MTFFLFGGDGPVFSRTGDWWRPVFKPSMFRQLIDFAMILIETTDNSAK